MLNLVTHEMEAVVTRAMVELLEEKNKRNGMVSINDIAEHLQEKGYSDYRYAVVQLVLSEGTLIPNGYVNYFKNERKFRYYGITKKCWEAYDAQGESA